MNPGLLKHKITFQKVVIYDDELGQKIEEWQDYKTTKSMIKTVKGTEFQNETVNSSRIYRFVIRYRNDIDSDMRIKYKGRIFDIIEAPINDDEQDITLTIVAKERVNNGN